MRVVNIIEEGKLGGPQVRMAAVAAALKGRVDTMVVMPEENSEAFQQRCDALAVPYKVLAISRITKEWRVALRYVVCFLLEIVQIRKLLRQGGFDLVHISGGSWQYKGLIAGRLAGKKVLWHLNDTAMPWLFRQLFMLCSPLADGYIFASVRSRDYYGPLVKNNNPQFVIPAPVDTAQFDPAQSYRGDEDIVRRWGGKLVIGMVANISQIKGVDIFIRMAAALNAQFDNLVFVVIGQVYQTQQRYFGRLKELCDSLSVTNIEFVGARSEVRPLLKRFDIYVCSSRAESSPIAVWEAMSMGKAIVSTDVGDVALYVRDGHAGFVVDSGDWEALAERIGHFVGDSEMRRRFGCQARAIAIDELDIGKCAQLHWVAYSHVLGN